MFNVFMKTRLGLAASHIIGKSILFEKYFPKIIIHFINIYLLYAYKVYACTYISRGIIHFLNITIFSSGLQIGNESTSLGKIIDPSLMGRQCDTPDRMN